MDKSSRFIDTVKQNEGLIIKIADLYTDCPQDKEDLYQEIIFQLWKSFDSFKEKSKISTWMYRVALNTAIYYLKLGQRKINSVPIDPKTDWAAEEADRTDEERIRLLYERIQSLNLLEKGLILLYLEGKSHQEIAEIIGITTSNVGTKISRIKEKLKSQIIKT